MTSRHSQLWKDQEIADLLSAEKELALALRFESALAGAQAGSGLISSEAASAVIHACQDFELDEEQLAHGVRRDGMIVPELVRQIRETLPVTHREALHFRSTSQDVIDTVTVMTIGLALEVLSSRMHLIIGQLDEIGLASGSVPQMARTRMQRALPLTLQARLEAWCAPFRRHIERLGELRPRVLVLQVGGPIGVDDGPWITELARLLGLKAPSRSWHTARDGFAELASWASLVTGSLGKIGQDIALMAQNEIGEVVIEGGGKSSAMHHKSNPVGAEILVALARYNAGLCGIVHQSLVHEQERSGAAWALEWMTLPPMLETTGAALRHCSDLLSRSDFRTGRNYS
jgi:3-carboxy-cis,cis-muconate cycloisomerase